MHPLMPMIARERIIAAARWLLDEGAWCMYEVCAWTCPGSGGSRRP